uniref:Uncharacterized protein n=1 Tax=Myotis myotis TaxID=51298 RepID=A0A7J7U5J0_MYOMY|nr:hypothetical protein mMyoMyo1_008879 [Myotis myotis]
MSCSFNWSWKPRDFQAAQRCLWSWEREAGGQPAGTLCSASGSCRAGGAAITQVGLTQSNGRLGREGFQELSRTCEESQPVLSSPMCQQTAGLVPRAVLRQLLSAGNNAALRTGHGQPWIIFSEIFLKIFKRW